MSVSYLSIPNNNNNNSNKNSLRGCYCSLEASCRSLFCIRLKQEEINLVSATPAAASSWPKPERLEKRGKAREGERESGRRSWKEDFDAFFIEKYFLSSLTLDTIFRGWSKRQIFAGKTHFTKMPVASPPKTADFFRKITEFRPLFSLFSSYLETVNRWLFNLSRRWLDSNPGPLVSLSNVAQSLAANLHWFLIG